VLLDERVRAALHAAGMRPTQSRIDRVGFTQAERKVLNAATLKREALELAAAKPSDGFSVAATQRRRGGS
jgi:hypothetical protein